MSALGPIAASWRLALALGFLSCGLFGCQGVQEVREIISLSCPGPAQDTPGGPAIAGGRRCSYIDAAAYHATHDGGPWIHVDLTASPDLELLKAFHEGTSKRRVYYPDGPLLPPLNIVHAYVCLSDPTVVYGKCPNDYPNNPGNAGLGYNLNPQVIARLEQGLTMLRAAKLKVVLRFTYNWPCSADPNQPPPPSCHYNNEQDAPLSVIGQHMAALAPVLQKHKDVILALQAGFIGRWGEWHNSTSGNDTPDAHNTFLDWYTKLFQGGTNLEVRYPYVLLDYASYRYASNTITDVLKLGIGMHDDYFASNAGDGGTFLPGPVNPTQPYAACLLKQTMAAVARAYTMTGEVTELYEQPKPPPCPSGYPNPTSFETFAADYSLTTLNVGFPTVAWTSWVQTGQFQRIVKSVGPHLSLVSAIVTPDVTPRIDVVFRNSGWAAIARPRPLWLVIKQGDRILTRQQVAFDLRTVRPGQEASAEIALPPWRDYLPGTYQLYLWAPDASERLRDDAAYALMLENVGVGDRGTGLNRLATVTIH